MTAPDDIPFDAQRDPVRDARWARALGAVDHVGPSDATVTAMRARIVDGVGVRATAPWVVSVARPARRALPWAVMVAAASLLLTWTLPVAGATDDGWTGTLLDASDHAVSLGLPASPDALLQESWSE
jgi:hypothetical protein